MRRIGRRLRSARRAEAREEARDAIVDARKRARDAVGGRLMTLKLRITVWQLTIAFARHARTCDRCANKAVLVRPLIRRRAAWLISAKEKPGALLDKHITRFYLLDNRKFWIEHDHCYSSTLFDSYDGMAVQIPSDIRCRAYRLPSAYLRSAKWFLEKMLSHR